MKSFIFAIAIMFAFAFSSAFATQYESDGVYAHYGTVADVAIFNDVKSFDGEPYDWVVKTKYKYDLAEIDNQMFMYALHSFNAGKHEVGWRNFSF